MTMSESLMVALFCSAGVFSVLLALCFIIKLFSFSLGFISNRKTTKPITEPIFKPVTWEQTAPVAEEDFSSGNLKLRDVDEPAAAMIMAIISDESGIPLSELCFKSIKLLRQD